MWPRWLTDGLTGKTSLARAFWLYGFGGSVVYSLIAWLFPETPAGFTVYTLIGLALSALWSVILWRCAPNSRSAFLGRLVRTAVVVGLITVPLMLYMLFTNPEALLPPNNRWRGPRGVVCLAPGALEDGVRPRRLAGVGARPLNFIVMRLRYLALLVLLSACVHAPRHGGDPATCVDVGSEWKLRSPPINAAQLIALLNADNPNFADPKDHDVYWFQRPEGQLLYCQAAKCDGLWATLSKDNGHWLAHKELGSVWITADCRR